MLQCSAAENAPQAVFEALAAGTPIVASDIGAHAELLRTGLYPLGDVSALSRGLSAAAQGFWQEQSKCVLQPWSQFAASVAAFCSGIAEKTAR